MQVIFISLHVSTYIISKTTKAEQMCSAFVVFLTIIPIGKILLVF